MSGENKKIDNWTYFKLWIFDTFLVAYASFLGIWVYCIYEDVIDKYFK